MSVTHFLVAFSYLAKVSTTLFIWIKQVLNFKNKDSLYFLGSFRGNMLADILYM